MTSKNYPKGTIVQARTDLWGQFTQGRDYVLREDFNTSYGMMLVEADDGGVKNGWDVTYFKVIKKPKAPTFAHSFSPGGMPAEIAVDKADATYSIQLHSKLRSQVGGDHYNKLPIQPLEYILANKLPFAEGAIVKYITRWRDKGGILDLRKVIQTCEVLIEEEEMRPTLSSS